MAILTRLIETTPAPTNSGPARIPYAEMLAALVTRTEATHEMRPVRSPFDGEVLGTVPVCGAGDVKLALQRARRAQTAWAERPLRERKAVFLRYHDLVLRQQVALMDLLQLEGGKARLSALEEVLDVALNSRYYAFHAAGYLRPRRRQGVLPLVTWVQEVRHPLGVVGLISPWNYPLTMAVSDAIPAMLAGNAVVMKPAEETPLTALRAMQLLLEAGLPADVFQIVTGRGRVIGPAMLEGIDFLCFTGSTATGRTLAGQAGERLIKCSLELGGKNPAIVLDDADVEKSVTGIVHGCFASSGQLCISIERLYVQNEVYDRFVESLVHRVMGLTISPALDFSIDIGSLISQEQFDKTVAHVADAVSKGATVLAGGRARPELGPYFYEPTLLAGVTPEMVIFREETFGPVTSIYRFESVEQAIDLANDSEFGLNASVWTRNVRLGQQIARRIRAGTVNVNEAYGAAWGSIDAPMGGMKASGLSRRHGAEGIQKFTETQTVATQYLIPLRPFGPITPPRFAAVMTLVLKILKYIPGLR